MHSVGQEFMGRRNAFGLVALVFEDFARVAERGNVVDGCKIVVDVQLRRFARIATQAFVLKFGGNLYAAIVRTARTRRASAIRRHRNASNAAVV